MHLSTFTCYSHFLWRYHCKGIYGDSNHSMDLLPGHSPHRYYTSHKMQQVTGLLLYWILHRCIAFPAENTNTIGRRGHISLPTSSKKEVLKRLSYSISQKKIALLWTVSLCKPRYTTIVKTNNIGLLWD